VALGVVALAAAVARWPLNNPPPPTTLLLGTNPPDKKLSVPDAGEVLLVSPRELDLDISVALVCICVAVVVGVVVGVVVVVGKAEGSVGWS